MYVKMISQVKSAVRADSACSANTAMQNREMHCIWVARYLQKVFPKKFLPNLILVSHITAAMYNKP